MDQKFSVSGTTDAATMRDLPVGAPAINFVEQENKYYGKLRGPGIGVATDTGQLRNTIPGEWKPLLMDDLMHRVQNKTELDALDVDPPALAFRYDTQRLYLRIGPEGYGGADGTTPMRDPQGNIVYEGASKVTGVVYEAQYASNHTLYVPNCNIHVGNVFTIDTCVDGSNASISFIVASLAPFNGAIQIQYAPAFDTTQFVGKTLRTSSLTTQIIPVPTTNLSDTNQVVIHGLTGAVVRQQTFSVANRSGVFKIVDITNDVWTFEPFTRPFQHGAIVTMTNTGVPKLEARQPDVWILLSHLYEGGANAYL